MSVCAWHTWSNVQNALIHSCTWSHISHMSSPLSSSSDQSTLQLPNRLWAHGLFPQLLWAFTFSHLTFSSFTLLPRKIHPNQSIEQASSQYFSPWIVATTFLECLLARNSRYQIPCHVPVAKWPLEMGTVMFAPIRALFTWAFFNAF